jgi:hypothetical protein
VRDLVVRTASGDDCSDPVLDVRESGTGVHIGLLAQRDSRLDEHTFYIARITLAGKGSRSISFTGARWSGARPKMWH